MPILCNGDHSCGWTVEMARKQKWRYDQIVTPCNVW